MNSLLDKIKIKINNNKEQNTNSKVSENNYFLSLGAGHNQINLINAAKELGYNVIAVDKNKKAPGFELANLQMYCSLIKPKKILNNLKNIIPIYGELVGVGCRSFGRANFSSALIAKNLSLPLSISPSNLNLFNNKKNFKNLMFRLKIPTAGSFVITNPDPTTLKDRCKVWEKRLPLVARPMFGHAKLGVRIIHNFEDFYNFLKNHKNITNIIFDEYYEGKEVTVMGLVNSGRFHLVCISDKKIREQDGQIIEVQHHFPSQISDELKQNICTYMQNICNETKINYSPMVAEFLINDLNKEKPICMIEASPETGGEYLADYLVPAGLGFNYFKDLVQIYSDNITENFSDHYNENVSKVIICFVTQRNGKLA